VVLQPLADANRPTAVALEPFAKAACPTAVLLQPVAPANWPTAVLPLALAVDALPNALELVPVAVALDPTAVALPPVAVDPKPQASWSSAGRFDAQKAGIVIGDVVCAEAVRTKPGPACRTRLTPKAVPVMSADRRSLPLVAPMMFAELNMF